MSLTPNPSPFSPENWCAHALAGNLIVSLGQIDKATATALNRLVREGRLARCRGYWTAGGLGPLKTIWAAPHALWAVGQLHSISETTPAFYAAPGMADAG